MESPLAPHDSRKSLSGIWFIRLLGAGTLGCCSLLLGACGAQPEELEERVTLLQKELDRTQSELKSATQALQSSKEELAKVKGNAAGTKRESTIPAPVTSTIPSREALEASYMAEAKTLKKQLQSQLKDFTLGSFTLHNVQLPDNQFPITSWISLAFQTGDGKQCRLDFAVKADAKGGWVFPEPAEIARRAGEAKKVAATSDSSQNRASQPAPNDPPPNVPMTMPSSSTSVIQWPNSNPPSRDTAKTDPAAKPNPDAAPLDPKTAPQQNPKQTVPADRDVLIRF
jgi:hypothetical protein